MKRGAILCNAILLIFFANMAVNVAIAQKMKRSSKPVIESFGLRENKLAFIGSKVNLTCKMNHAEVSIFRKAGATIREGGRFTYFFKSYGADGIVGNLEITNVVKKDEGVFTCYAYNAGYLVNKTFTLITAHKTVNSI